MHSISSFGATTSHDGQCDLLCASEHMILGPIKAVAKKQLHTAMNSHPTPDSMTMIWFLRELCVELSQKPSSTKENPRKYRKYEQIKKTNAISWNGIGIACHFYCHFACHFMHFCVSFNAICILLIQTCRKKRGVTCHICCLNKHGLWLQFG